MQEKNTLKTLVPVILLLVVLAGCSPAPAPTPTPPTTPPQTATTVNGKGLYDANCAGCHGAGGAGGQGGPALNTGEFSDPAKVVNITKKGKGGMPPFEGKLKEEEIQAIGQYVAGLKK